MQNVILQMGLCLVAPGVMQIHKLQRWVLRCHACYTVTPEVEKIFCLKCGNGGTLRIVAVTVGKVELPWPRDVPESICVAQNIHCHYHKAEERPSQRTSYCTKINFPRSTFTLGPRRKQLTKTREMTDNCIFLQHHCDKKSVLQPPVRKALQVFSGKRNPKGNYYSFHAQIICIF